MKSLVIAEKPSVGRDIARVLNCKKSGDGCLEGEKYVVTSRVCHLQIQNGAFLGSIFSASMRFIQCLCGF